jgi:Outer membrane protein Omp28/Secretion system C-terminal sorting domain
MKKITTLLATLLLICGIATAQTKKYALVEHFTNTRCGTCGANNPGFFSRINISSNTNLHHLAIHPAIPYSSCVFYQANRTPQDNRATYYNLGGTPSASINGGSLQSVNNISAALVAQNAANNAIASVRVSEANNTVTVRVRAFQNLPASTYKLYVALAEKVVTYAAPNGEGTHYNVFRQFVNTGNDAGDAMAAIANGAETTYTFSYTPNSAWVSSQIYALAWVQNTTTKEVINSGTRFDPTTSTQETSVDAQVAVAPNPTTQKTVLSFDNLTPQYLTVSNTLGQVLSHVKLSDPTRYELDLSKFAAGTYYVKVQTSEGVALKKIIKE